MNNSNSHTTSQLIHAAVELVVGACITFWLNRKISAVSQKVGLLEDKLKFYENMLGQHHELIKKLFSIVENTARGSVPLTKLVTPVTPVTVSPAAFSTSESDPEIKTTWTTSLPTLIDKEGTDSAELDAILSSEIKDLQIDQTATLT